MIKSKYKSCREQGSLSEVLGFELQQDEKNSLCAAIDGLSLEERADRQKKECPGCGKMLHLPTLNKHAENGCGPVKQPCPACGKMLHKATVARHAKKGCPPPKQ